jgi:hypothetical protein
VPVNIYIYIYFFLKKRLQVGPTVDHLVIFIYI